MSGAREYGAAGVFACLVVSGAVLAVAPLLLPADYSWVAHTTSESAAQGVGGAWLARLGFLLFGFGIIWLAALNPRRWGRWARVLHTGAGVFLIVTAAFSARPWDVTVTYDPIEDLLHSIAAAAIGFSFALGVSAVALGGASADSEVRRLDVVAVVASIALPVGMTSLDDVAGALQRGMFLMAYVWYAREALLARRS